MVFISFPAFPMARKQVSSTHVLPPAWNQQNTHAVLWHGTIRTAADDIQANGIDLTRGRHGLDFGRGFYTTTARRQAGEWAWTKYRNLPRASRAATTPALVKFRVPLDALAALNSLMFVRGDARHDAFWAFVYHCRNSTAAAPRSHLHPGRVAPDDWYDVVCGPLAATWPPDGRTTIPDSDQFGFHTAASAAMLNNTIGAGPPAFEIIPL